MMQTVDKGSTSHVLVADLELASEFIHRVDSASVATAIHSSEMDHNGYRDGYREDLKWSQEEEIGGKFWITRLGDSDVVGGLRFPRKTEH